MPEIRKFVTVSASHLPQMLAESLFEDPLEPGNGLVLGGYHGLFVFARGDHPGYPDSVQKLLQHAAANLDCSFVLFDIDGDVLDGFVTFDDDEELA